MGGIFSTNTDNHRVSGSALLGSLVRYLKDKDQLRKIMLQDPEVDNINKYGNARNLARKTVSKTKRKYDEQLLSGVREKTKNKQQSALCNNNYQEKAFPIHIGNIPQEANCDLMT